MSQREDEALELWYLAQASPIGIEIYTNEPKIAGNLLRRVRQKSLDPLLESFVVRISPLDPESKVWIVRTVPRNQLLPPVEEHP